jgi:hypothetical protein
MAGTGGTSLRKVPVETVLAIAMAVSGLILVGLTSQLTFMSDEWELLVVRRGWSAADLLDPFNEHIILAPAIVWKVLLAVFGMDSAMPFQLVAVGAFLLSVALLFAYLRPRVGEWPALIGAFLVLFLGAAFEDLLFAFQLGYYGAAAAGIGALIALDRGTRQGDRIACLLLVVSLAFSSLGIPFVAGALVHILLSSRPKLGRLYVALLPLELWGIWWLGWGHEAESNFSLGNLPDVPEYVLDSAAAGIVSLLGLATGDGSEADQPHLVYGQILLLLGVGAAVARLWRRRAVPAGLVVALAIGLSFWGLTAMNLTEVRLATSSRYQYPSAVFLLLIAGELLRGVRIDPRALAVAGVVALAAAWGGMSLMFREHEDRWLPASDSLKASLAALEIAGASGDPAYTVAFSGNISAPLSEYLDAVSEHGSPAFSAAELEERPEEDRASADATLAEALGLALGPAAGEPGPCREVGTGSPLPWGALNLVNGGQSSVDLAAGRYSDGFPVPLGPLPPGGRASLEVPPDGSGLPWRLSVTGDSLLVCRGSEAV